MALTNRACWLTLSSPTMQHAAPLPSLAKALWDLPFFSWPKSLPGSWPPLKPGQQTSVLPSQSHLPNVISPIWNLLLKVGLKVLQEGTSLMAAEEQHQRNIPVSFQLRVTGGFLHTLHEAHPTHGETEWKGVKLHRAEVLFSFFFFFLKKKFCGSLSRWKREKK